MNRASGLRERIRQAIEAPVGEAEKLLSELQDADAETRLSILISGWGRGLAGALEELAIAVDELRREADREPAEPSPPPAVEEPAASEQTATEEQAADTDLDDEHLRDEARRSREDTAELQKETEQARRELEG
jgi:hypothetical protein